MTRKTEEAYEQLFEYIKNVLAVGMEDPINIMTDYERGLQNALRRVFPTSALHGCWFHYAKVITINVHFV